MNAASKKGMINQDQNQERRYSILILFILLLSFYATNATTLMENSMFATKERFEKKKKVRVDQFNLCLFFD